MQSLGLRHAVPSGIVHHQRQILRLPLDGHVASWLWRAVHHDNITRVRASDDDRGVGEPSTSGADMPQLRPRKRLLKPKSPGSPASSGLAHSSQAAASSAPSKPKAPAAQPGAAKAKAAPKPAAQRAVAPALDDEEEEYYKDKQNFTKTILDESSPFYQPALTDEELAEDPPGHKSGYVAVIGKPNAGKSTLINALVGQKLSIVTYKPQTTRHRIMGIASDKDYQMILFDTPGVIEKKRTKLEERMMAAVVSSIKEAEAIIAVVDGADAPKTALGMFQPGENWNGPPMAVLLNKADLLTPEQLAELEAWYRDNCRAEAVFTGSAVNGDGVQALRGWAVSKLPEGPTLYPKAIVSEQPERFFVAECVREKIFLNCEQEVPYCTQVVVREFKERHHSLQAKGQQQQQQQQQPAGGAAEAADGGSGAGRGRMKDYIKAEIIVEKESQKGILIGRDGAMLKKIGLEARREIETFLGRGVFLELSVQVSKDWRDSKDALNQYGYFDPMLI